MREGEGPVKKFSRKSLRLLGTVGEPINPEAWEWYHRVVGDDRCPIYRRITPPGLARHRMHCRHSHHGALPASAIRSGD